jgi:hypothetical protein
MNYATVGLLLSIIIETLLYTTSCMPMYYSAKVPEFPNPAYFQMITLPTSDDSPKKPIVSISAARAEQQNLCIGVLSDGGYKAFGYFYNQEPRIWKELAKLTAPKDLPMKQLVYTTDGHPVYLGNTGRVHFFDGNKTWVDASEKGFYGFINISAGKDLNNVFAISAVCNVNWYQWRGSFTQQKNHTSWKKIDTKFDKQLAWIARGTDDVTCMGVSIPEQEETKIYWNFTTEDHNTFKRIYYKNSNNAVAWKANGDLYKYNSGSGKWDKLTSENKNFDKTPVEQAAIDEYGNIFVLSQAGDLWAFFVADYPTRYNLYPKIESIETLYNTVSTQYSNVVYKIQQIKNMIPSLDETIQKALTNINKITPTAIPKNVSSNIMQAKTAFDEATYNTASSLLSKTIIPAINSVKTKLTTIDTKIDTILYEAFDTFVTNKIKTNALQEQIDSLKTSIEKITNQAIKTSITTELSGSQSNLDTFINPLKQEATQSLSNAQETLQDIKKQPSKAKNYIDSALKYYQEAMKNAISVANFSKSPQAQSIKKIIEHVSLRITQLSINLPKLSQDKETLYANAIDIQNKIERTVGIRKKGYWLNTVKEIVKSCTTIQRNIDTATQELKAGNSQGAASYAQTIQKTLSKNEEILTKIKTQLKIK